MQIWLPFINEPIFGPNRPAQNPFNDVTTRLVLDYGISVDPLGLSVFFLISGFVIARTLDREAPSVFAVKRFFRIISASMFASVLTAAVVSYLCWRHGATRPN